MLQISPEIRDFIREHLHLSPAELALKLSKKKALPKQFILDQLNGIQKAKKKFPSLSTKPDIVYPNSRAVSQASSEETALYKSTLIENCERIADLSGGMGIDSMYLAKKCKQLDYVEPNGELLEISRHNFKVLGLEHIRSHHLEAGDFLSTSELMYDLIYVDPDRRKEGKRMISIEDCAPNLKELLPILLSRGKRVLVKYSPMLDIQAALKDLKNVKEVHIVSIDNEVKELLFLMTEVERGAVELICRELTKEGGSEFRFKIEEESNAEVEYAELGTYLYEPNAALLKAGAFKLLAQRFHLKKLAVNTHLYTADRWIKEFPGRIIKVMDSALSAKGLCKQANIVSRNSGMSVDEIKKKYKLKEGGDQFLYAFKNSNGERKFALGEKV